VIVGSLLGPADRAADSSFFFHAIQHLLVGMVGPMLIVLADPVQLALRAASPRVRRRVRAVVRSRAVRTLGSGFLPLALFAGGMFAIYLTPLYRLSVTDDTVHALVHIHLLASGSLLAWSLIGGGGEGSRPNYPARMLAVAALVPVHAVIGVALVSGRHVLTATPDPPFGWNALTDQRAGAALMWVAGELVTLVIAAVILMEWRAAEERIGARHDRLLDRSGEN